MVMTYSLILAVLIMVERFFEINLAARNQKKIVAMGAIEFGRNHYFLFFVLHAGWLLGWLYETLLYGSLSDLWFVWLTVFLMAEVLRYWCIISLGRFWNTRIFIVPGEQKVCRGPYRFIAHPNYLAVALVLVSVPLIFGAYRTAASATIINAILLLGIRIPAEARALQKLQ